VWGLIPHPSQDLGGRTTLRLEPEAKLKQMRHQSPLTHQCHYAHSRRLWLEACAPSPPASTELLMLPPLPP
jgi:hypothetical protein